MKLSKDKWITTIRKLGIFLSNLNLQPFRELTVRGRENTEEGNYYIKH